MTDTAQSAKAAWKPKMIRPGMPSMKPIAITYGPVFGPRDRFYMDHLMEMINLSDGQRTIKEIARIIGYEIGPIAPDVAVDMFEALEKAGFLTLQQPGG